MSTFYMGIALTDLDKDLAYSHSHSLFAMTDGRQEADRNIDYTEKLLSMDKGMLSKEQFHKISALNSVISMNYQICNGGIDQYFYNGYDEYHAPFHEQDVARLDKNAQVEMLKELAAFGKEVFAWRTDINEKLDRVISQFSNIYVENEEQFETIYSEEDELIWDEELSDWVDNPAYEEPYESSIGYQDVLYHAEHFDDAYYEVNDYLETLCEGYAQYLYKSIEKQQTKEPIDNLIKNAAKERSKDTFMQSPKELER